MVPEEIDQLGEKFDKLGWNEFGARDATPI